MIDIFGSIAGAASLALAIKAFCDGIKGDAGNDRLVFQIRHDAAVLESFAEIFGNVTQNTAVGTQERLAIEEICLVLMPLLEKLQAWMDKRERMQGQSAKRAEKLADKFTSLLWRNSDIRMLAAELSAWTERYHIRLGLLPPRLRNSLLERNFVDEKFETHRAVKALRLTFEELSISSTSAQASSLSLPESDLAIDCLQSRFFGDSRGRRVLVEYRAYQGNLGGTDLERLKGSISDLAVVLHHAEASLCRIPKCIGFIHQVQRNRFALLYEVPRIAVAGPDSQRPSTLLDLIKKTRPSPVDPSKQVLQPPQHPLNSRFELARKIACAVLYVQALGWVHKSIRSSNVILLQRVGTTDDPLRTLNDPYLCGFDAARSDKATSDQLGDAFWELNVYRHPVRQGLQPNERYSMNHDIYSLGVVLLEIGLWKPLLAYGGLKILRSSSSPIEVKEFFLNLANEGLPVVMGQKYCEVVKFCLEIDGETAVTAYTAIDEILTKLEEMSMGLH